MSFFLYSKCGEGAGLLKRLQDEGNNCSIYIEEKEYSNIYEGILSSTDYPDDSDIIIFDSSGNGVKADSFKRQGFRVFGACSFADKLENDRQFGLDFMTDHGIMIPETQTFKRFSDGINFVKSNKKTRFVFKPSGKDIPCKLTYSSSDTEDMISYLNYVEKNFGKDIDDFVLQEFIKGAIISSEFWVGKNGFVKNSFNQTIEVKKFMNDELGPSTGCSGNIVWPEDEDSPIAEMLRRIEEDLISKDFIGPIDLNTIITEDSIFGLEWTPRFGLDAMPSLLQLLGNDLGKFISDSFNNDSEMILLSCFSGGARLSIPPYPLMPTEKHEKKVQDVSPNVGIPIRGLEKYEDNCYFYEVMKKDDDLVHSNGTGVIACISDLGENIKDCYELVNEALEECKIPDKQYRTDLDSVLSKMYEDVKEIIIVWS